MQAPPNGLELRLLRAADGMCHLIVEALLIQLVVEDQPPYIDIGNLDRQTVLPIPSRSASPCPAELQCPVQLNCTSRRIATET
jgi:hypothetical protein